MAQANQIKQSTTGAGGKNASILPPPATALKQAKTTDQAKFSREGDKPATGTQAQEGNAAGEEELEEVRGRRRSKNDHDGRDHRCKYCDKTYLSYPALYTHTKQKHSVGPDGEQRAPPTSGRGRGRPRKNVSTLRHPALITTRDAPLLTMPLSVDLPAYRPQVR